MEYIWCLLCGAILGALGQWRFVQVRAVEAAEQRMKEIFAGRRKSP